jgi:hypothetical protein
MGHPHTALRYLLRHSPLLPGVFSKVVDRQLRG